MRLGLWQFFLFCSADLHFRDTRESAAFRPSLALRATRTGQRLKNRLIIFILLINVMTNLHSHGVSSTFPGIWKFCKILFTCPKFSLEITYSPEIPIFVFSLLFDKFDHFLKKFLRIFFWDFQDKIILIPEIWGGKFYISWIWPVYYYLRTNESVDNRFSLFCVLSNVKKV